MVKMVTWQPVDEAPEAKVHVTVILPSSSITAVEDWRPVVSANIIGNGRHTYVYTGTIPAGAVATVPSCA